MAVVKHYSIKNSPLALLKYITGETKEQKAEIVTGINCSVAPKSAYLEMSLCYESFAGEKFHRTKKPEGKEHIKMHHYVFSFKGKEVTPQAANRIVQEWAKKVFGDNRQILIAVHTDTDNIHVHVAVNAYDMKGKRWLDNKSTLNYCREVANKICKREKLNVIEKPKWNSRQSYAEWLARQNGISWKEKLCNDIDRIVLMEDVRNIDDLINQLCRNGYVVRQGKYLSVKPAKLQKIKAVRTLRLGDGYGLEELKYRIENKDKEMSLEKALSYTGMQSEYALCIRQIQIQFYRKDEHIKLTTYSELCKTADLLCYISENDIHSKEAFEKHVNGIAEKCDELSERCKALKEKIKEMENEYKNADRYIELISQESPWLPKTIKELSNYKLFWGSNVRSKEDLEKIPHELEKLKSELEQTQSEYDKAAANKKAVTTHYTTFLRVSETDFDRCRRLANEELAEYEANLQKSEKPKVTFAERVQQMADWAEMVHAKIAEKNKIEERQRAEEARRKRGDYSR